MYLRVVSLLGSTVTHKLVTSFQFTDQYCIPKSAISMTINVALYVLD